MTQTLFPLVCEFAFVGHASFIGGLTGMPGVCGAGLPFSDCNGRHDILSHFPSLVATHIYFVSTRLPFILQHAENHA